MVILFKLYSKIIKQNHDRKALLLSRIQGFWYFSNLHEDVLVKNLYVLKRWSKLTFSFFLAMVSLVEMGRELAGSE